MSKGNQNLVKDTGDNHSFKNQALITSFIQTTKGNHSNVLLQTQLDPFLIPKPKIPFQSIDVVRESTIEPKRGRGRPPKNKVTVNSIKTKAKNQEGTKNIENVKIEEISGLDDDETQKEGEVEKKRGVYSRISYKIRKEILEKYIEYKSDSAPLLEGKRKKESFNEFCRKLEEKYNKVCKFTTIKRICLTYDKNPNIYTELMVLCSNTKKANKSGHLKKREPTLTYDKPIDREIYDWIQCSSELGFVITRQIIKEKAKKLINPSYPDFKASDSWLDCFMDRHNLSLRKNNEKSHTQLEVSQELCEKFIRSMKDTIKKYNINPKYIINVDETPFFWEYLPRKIVTSKFSDKARAWKRGYHKVRSTIALATAADGSILKPTVILRRVTEYKLRANNDINAVILNSDNGWMTELNMIDWCDQVLFPYVGNNPCLLLMDSYESHISQKIQAHLSKHPNIQVGIIIGGTTDRV